MTWPKKRASCPLAFDADPAWLYVRDQHRGKAAIFKLNVMDRAADRILVVADPKFDLNGELVYAPGRKKVVGVRYSATDERVLFWDYDAQRLQARIDRAIPGTVNIIHSSSDDGRLHVVKSSGAAHPHTGRFSTNATAAWSCSASRILIWRGLD
jgi:hypothetical protein